MHGRVQLNACSTVSWNTHKRPFKYFHAITGAMKENGHANSVGLFQEIRSWTAGARNHGFVLRKGATKQDVKSDCGVLLPWDLDQSVCHEAGGAYWYGVIVHNIVFLSCHSLDHTLEGGRTSDIVQETTEFIRQCRSRCLGGALKIVVGLDGNVSLPSNFEGITGPNVLPPLKPPFSHTTSTKSRYSFFQSLNSVNDSR